MKQTSYPRGLRYDDLTMRAGRRQTDTFMGWGFALAGVLFLMYVYPGDMAPVTPRFDGTCQTVELAASAEDIRIDPQTGVAYLTYNEAPQNGSAPPGTVMLLDLNAKEPRVRAALASVPDDFHPKSLSLYVPVEGPKRLFVISRKRLGTHSIEIFEQSSTGHFVPVETVRGRLLWSPHAIVAVGPRQFYFTNDSGLRMADEPDAKKRVSSALRDNRSNVVYFDGQQMRQVADRLRLANGIAVSNSGRIVYVSETGRRRLRIYERSPETGALTSREQIKLDGAPDSLTVDAQDNLWIASHAGGFAAIGRALTGARQPSQILKFTPTASRDERVSLVYVNDGEALSAATVAAVRGRDLVIGAQTERKLLFCKRNDASVPGIRPDEIPPGISGLEKDS